MILRLISLTILTSSIAAAQTKDFEQYKDPALFTRMPHYVLTGKDSVVETPFDAYEFPVKNGIQKVEGHHLHYAYDFDEAAGTSPGFLQIVRNYQAAAKKIGGEVLSESVRQTTVRIARSGQETWMAVEAFNEGREYELLETELGPNDPALTGSLYTYAGLLMSEHRYTEAVAPAERAWRILKDNRQNVSTPSLAGASGVLSAVYLHTGRAVEAESFARQAVEMAEAALGSDRPEVRFFLSTITLLF